MEETFKNDVIVFNKSLSAMLQDIYLPRDYSSVIVRNRRSPDSINEIDMLEIKKGPNILKVVSDISSENKKPESNEEYIPHQYFFNRFKNLELD